MIALVERIREGGRVLPGGLLKVDGFLNHRLEPELTLAMGRAFRERFEAVGVSEVDVVVTAEASGIAPALATGIAYGAPVVYARKKRPATMPGPVFQAEAPSPTKGGVTPLVVSSEALQAGDRVLLIDDFLASGLTIDALARLILGAGADLQGIGTVIEKTFQEGRVRLEPLGVPVVSLAAVDAVDEGTGRVDVREG
ncbi:MAG: xanthine phosphoribosyltransferase [Trueperaceae bacterium]|nr:xanthine phosphoribosyltransferase [Trueperaceae bacterium]